MYDYEIDFKNLSLFLFFLTHLSWAFGPCHITKMAVETPMKKNLPEPKGQ